MVIREKGYQEERAERDGRIARACNTPLAANPYGTAGHRLLRPPHEELWRKAWVRGWNKTDAELRDVRSATRDRTRTTAPFATDAETDPLRKRAA